MLFFGILSMLLAVASAENCYTDVQGLCNSVTSGSTFLPHCTARYGAINHLKVDLQSYANANIESSFEFLLLSSYFGNFEAQREGFKKLYRKYSDKIWEDAIDLIKYITKRGGNMNFNQVPHTKQSGKENKVYELHELGSLAKALDNQKLLADEAIRIHSAAQSDTKYDAAVAHYIEEHFLESSSDRVRELAGYASDLKNLLTEHDSTVSVFLFDEILKKSL